MKQKAIFLLLLIASIGCIGAAALSVAMLISAVQFGEWGRVLVYSVTTAFSVEMAVLSIGKLKNKEKA